MNTTERNCVISRAQTTTVLQCNTSVSGREEGTMGFVQRKRLPWSAANSSVRYIEIILSVHYNTLTYSYKTDPALCTKASHAGTKSIVV